MDIKPDSDSAMNSHYRMNNLQGFILLFKILNSSFIPFINLSCGWIRSLMFKSNVTFVLIRSALLFCEDFALDVGLRLCGSQFICSFSYKSIREIRPWGWDVEETPVEGSVHSAWDRTLWQRFMEKPHRVVLARGAHTFVKLIIMINSTSFMCRMKFI